MIKRDLTICPTCGGPADNGFDRCDPPAPYECTKCMKRKGIMNKEMKSSWRLLPNVHCQHCGGALVGRPIRHTSIVIEGCEPMEYWHANGEQFCTQRYRAAPYSDYGTWQAYHQNAPEGEL